MSPSPERSSFATSGSATSGRATSGHATSGSVVPVYDHPEAVKAFVAAGLWAGQRQFGAATAIGFATAEEGLVAGFVYHGYEPEAGAIEISAYASRHNWCTRSHLERIFAYPFEELGCRLVVARHSEDNKRVRRIWRALGAQETLIPELHAPGVAEAVALLNRQDWQNAPYRLPANRLPANRRPRYG